MSDSRKSRGQSRVNSVTRLLFFVALVSVWGLSGCAHSKKSAGGTSGTKREKGESGAEVAVRETTEDERLTPQIQKDMNELFFREKEIRPGGLNAFSPDRLQELEEAMKNTDRKAIRYYLENREYFDRIEDPGGGFRVLPNAKRLTPYLKTKVGRRKLFEMDTARVREMVTNPCLSDVEDCGEYSSDATENLSLIEAWTKKYPDADFAADREKFLREYAQVLRRYEDRLLKGVPKKVGAPGLAAKEASLRIGGQRRAVEALISVKLK